MNQYKNLLKKILSEGTEKKSSRNNMPETLSCFGDQFIYDLSERFPMNTLKPVSWKGVVWELIWFLKGDTNIKFLDDRGVDFMWHEDAYNYYQKINNNDKLSFEDFKKQIKSWDGQRKTRFKSLYNIGDCGNQYGKLWRDFDGVDQIWDLISGLTVNPMSRRHLVTALNPTKYEDMALFPCHNFFQLNVRELNRHQSEYYEHIYQNNTPKYFLDCKFYQRSADMVLGVPYNTASYALLTHIIAKICNMIPGKLIHTFGDAHIYINHIDAANEMIQREEFNFPKLEINPEIDFSRAFRSVDWLVESLDVSDFKLVNYRSHPKLKSKTKLSTGLK